MLPAGHNLVGVAAHERDGVYARVGSDHEARETVWDAADMQRVDGCVWLEHGHLLDDEGVYLLV